MENAYTHSPSLWLATSPRSAAKRLHFALRFDIINSMKAVVSVIGKDRTGIIAAVSRALADWEINIEDISQTIMQDNFVMIMLVDAEKSTVPFDKIGEKLQDAVKSLGVTVMFQHEDLFNAMQRV